MVSTTAKLLAGKAIEERKKKRAERAAEITVPGTFPPQIDPTKTPFPQPPTPTPTISGGITPPAPTPEPTGDIKVLTDARGRPSGVELPDGRTFLGLNRKDVQKIVAAETAKTAIPAGAIGPEQLAAQQAGEEALGQIGEIPTPTPEQLAAELEKLNIPANLKSALAGFIPEALTKAGTFAAAGAGVGGVATLATGGLAAPLIPILAGAGAVAGIASTLLSNLKAEAKEDTTAAGKEYKLIRSNMRILISEVNAGRMTPDFAVNRFNAQLARMNQLERQLKELTSTNLKDFLSDGSDQMAQIAAWQEFERPNIEASLQGAIQRPDPAKVLTDDQIDELLSEGDIE